MLVSLYQRCVGQCKAQASAGARHELEGTLGRPTLHSGHDRNGLRYEVSLSRDYLLSRETSVWHCETTSVRAWSRILKVELL